MPTYVCRRCKHLLDLPDIGKGHVLRCPQCRAWNSYEPASPSATQGPDYRCPFCTAAQAPVWQRYWGRVSVLVGLLGVLPLVVAGVFILVAVVREVGKAIAGAESSQTLVLVGASSASGLLVFSGFLLFSLPWNHCRICPECRSRITWPS